MKSYLNNQAPPFTISPSKDSNGGEEDQNSPSEDDHDHPHNSPLTRRPPQHTTTQSQVQSPTFLNNHSLGMSLDGCRSWSAPPGQASFYLPFPIDEDGFTTTTTTTNNTTTSNDTAYSNFNESGSRLHRLQSRLRQMELKEESERRQSKTDESDPLMHPGYGAYFHNAHRLDHRLPPPPYSPGTSSWQHMWPPSSQKITTSACTTTLQTPPLQQTTKPVSLVDRIQADFPRTPSPVYGLPPQLPSLPLQPPPLSPSSSLYTSTVTAVTAATAATPSSSTLASPPFKPKSPPAVTVKQESEAAADKKIAERKISFSAAATAIKIEKSPVTTSTTIAATTTTAKDKKAKSKKSKEQLLQHLTSLEDLQGQMFTASTDQHGSRFIQQQLEFSSDEMKTSILMELLPHLSSLVTDVFGNYVVQKIFEHGSEEHKVLLAKSLQNDVLRLSLQMYGCRVVQKALEHLPMKWKLSLIGELKGNVLRCVRDQNGNHVIQKCIECCCKMGPSSLIPPFLLDSFKDQIATLAKHPYGCRVIQRIFEQETKVCPTSSEMIRSLIDEMHLSIKDLIEDQYGNYVVQHLLSIDSREDCSLIIRECITGSLLFYSKHKFASNVVEKCVAHGPKADRMLLIEESLTSVSSIENGSNGKQPPLLEEWPSPNVPVFVLMMKDQFANYVLQKMLDVVEGEQRDRLLKEVRYNLGVLRKLAFGKHCLVKLERMLQNYQ